MTVSSNDFEFRLTKQLVKSSNLLKKEISNALIQSRNVRIMFRNLWIGALPQEGLGSDWRFGRYRL